MDTSVWIDHLHRGDDRLASQLESALVCTHPLVIGELSLGSIRGRQEFLALLQLLPKVRVASHDEVLTLVDDQHLHGRGLGVVDAHLIASALLTPGCILWTRDRRLGDAALGLGVSVRLH